MIKHLFKVIVLFLVLIGNIASGQSFTIHSIGGSSQLINVSIHEESSALIISALQDTITIKDFNNLTGKIAVLNKSFLKIDYRVRAGTGMDDQRTIILCFSGKHLIKSLHVTSFFKEEFIDFSKPVDTANLVAVKTVYALKLDLKESMQQRYTLSVKIHKEKKSKPEPKANYNHDNGAELNYDSNRNIFYSTHENVSQYFTIYDAKTGKDTKRYIMGTFPAVKLGEYEYYFIKNDWYEKNKYNDLIKYTY